MSTAGKPLVYVAGPITADPLTAARDAVDIWPVLRAFGLVPFLPQLSVLHEMIDPQPYQTWIDYGLDVVENCAAVIRLPGESPGADRETAHATDIHIPVFPWTVDGRANLAEWAIRFSTPSTKDHT